MQVWLDRHNFSCGSIDGVWGIKTDRAWRAWSEANPEEPFVASEELQPNLLLTSYTVTKEDHEALVAIPQDWSARAQLHSMGYETIVEMIAERYHLSPRALALLNPNVPFPNPPAGTILHVPDVLNVATESATRITINLSEYTLSAYNSSDKLIAQFPVSIARKQNKRPEGTLKIDTIVPNPNYLYDPVNYNHHTGESKQVIPPGPNNPVGAVWFGLNLPGYGIHGSPYPERVGSAESQGCFRLCNWDALKLLQMISLQTPITVF